MAHVHAALAVAPSIGAPAVAPPAPAALPPLSIALSGGGIRSAAFCAGVLEYIHCYVQRPIRHMSCVSGGGYVGAARCVWQTPPPPGAAAVAPPLAAPQPVVMGLPPLVRPPPAVSERVRAHGSYLCDCQLSGWSSCRDNPIWHCAWLAFAFVLWLFLTALCIVPIGFPLALMVDWTYGSSLRNPAVIGAFEPVYVTVAVAAGLFGLRFVLQKVWRSREPDSVRASVMAIVTVLAWLFAAGFIVHVAIFTEQNFDVGQSRSETIEAYSTVIIVVAYPLTGMLSRPLSSQCFYALLLCFRRFEFAISRRIFAHRIGISGATRG